jgi:hypothetical protein
MSEVAGQAIWYAAIPTSSRGSMEKGRKPRIPGVTAPSSLGIIGLIMKAVSNQEYWPSSCASQNHSECARPLYVSGRSRA